MEKINLSNFLGGITAELPKKVTMKAQHFAGHVSRIFGNSKHGSRNLSLAFTKSEALFKIE